MQTALIFIALSPAGKYVFKVNTRNTSLVFIVNFEQVHADWEHSQNN